MIHQLSEDSLAEIHPLLSAIADRPGEAVLGAIFRQKKFKSKKTGSPLAY
jgi:hypothetical protein